MHHSFKLIDRWEESFYVKTYGSYMTLGGERKRVVKIEVREKPCVMYYYTF